MDDSYLVEGLGSLTLLKRRLESGEVLVDAQDMSRNELEREYVDVVSKYVAISELFFYRLKAS